MSSTRTVDTVIGSCSYRLIGHMPRPTCPSSWIRKVLMPRTALVRAPISSTCRLESVSRALDLMCIFNALRSLPRAASFSSVTHRRAFASAATMDYDTILQGKYPAKRHAQRVVEYIRSKVPNANGVLYLESRATKFLEDNDQEEHFRYVLFLYDRTCVPARHSTRLPGPVARRRH